MIGSRAVNRATSDARILLVDDNAEVVLLWRMVLETHGGFRDITEAFDGREALSLMAMTEPDVVITDHWMGDISGLEVIDATRALCPHAVVVMSSSDPSVRRESLERGASSFMTKFSSVTEALAIEVRALLDCAHANVPRAPTCIA